MLGRMMMCGWMFDSDYFDPSNIGYVGLELVCPALDGF